MQLGLKRRRLFMFGAVYFVQAVFPVYRPNFFTPHMDPKGVGDRLAIVAPLALFGRGHRTAAP